MSAALKERTGDGIFILHGNKDSENFTIAQVRSGALDMARVNLSVFNTIAPATIVPSLPFLFRSTQHMRRILDGPIGEEILASLEAEGFIGLCFYDTGPRSFYSSKGPIRSVDDMKRLAVRVQPADISTEMIKAMGAKPIAVPFDHVTNALAAGLVDAAESSWSGYLGAGHGRVAKYFSLTEHSMMPGVLVFSKRSWSELTAADQQAIRAAARESVTSLRGQLDRYEASARLVAERGGTVVVDAVDRKSFAAALKPLYPKLLTDPALRAMIREIEGEVEISRVP